MGWDQGASGPDHAEEGQVDSAGAPGEGMPMSVGVDDVHTGTRTPPEPALCWRKHICVCPTCVLGVISDCTLAVIGHRCTVLLRR